MIFEQKLAYTCATSHLCQTMGYDVLQKNVIFFFSILLSDEIIVVLFIFGTVNRHHSQPGENIKADQAEAQAASTSFAETFDFQ